MATFVVVHGAWGGTWSWKPIGKEPGSHQAQRAERAEHDPRWTYFELNTGHNLHYTAPEETVEILNKLARG